MAKKRNQHVIFKKGYWVVIGELNVRIAFKSKEKEDAIKRGKKIAANQETKLIVHGKNPFVVDYKKGKGNLIKSQNSSRFNYSGFKLEEQNHFNEREWRLSLFE